MPAHVDQSIVKERIMRLTKTEIMEYIAVFLGMVGLLAYIQATTETRQAIGAAQVSSMMIEAGWTPGPGRGGPRITDAYFPADKHAPILSRSSWLRRENQG